MNKKQFFAAIFSLLGIFLFFYILTDAYKQYNLVKDSIQVKFHYLIVSAIFSMSFYLIGAYAWLRILNKLGSSIQTSPVLYIYLFSQFLKYLPGGIWNLPGRAVLIKSYEKNSSLVFSSLIIEIFYVLITGLILSTLVLNAFFADIWFWLLFILLIGLIVLFINTLSSPFYLLMNRIKKFKIDSLKNSREILILYLISWLCLGIGFYFLVLSLSPSIDFHIELIGMFPLSWIAGFVSPMPGGLGIREQVLESLFRSINLLGFSFIIVISRFWLMIIEIILFIMIFFKKYIITLKQKKRNRRTKAIVCYFGSHKPYYSRNNIIKRGLIGEGYSVIDCSSRANIIFRHFILFFKFIQIKDDVDIIIVSEMAHSSMPVAKLVSKLFNKKIIFDPLISAYDTIVRDRKLINNRLFGSLIFILDKISFKLADYVLADTNEHRKYFSRMFDIKIEKIETVLVGADTKYYFPAYSLGNVEKKTKFHVLFQGTYIPLHGIKYIVDAANVLRHDNEIIFIFIGNGQLYEETVNYSKSLGLTNIDFLPIVSQDELRNHIINSDICLGIFGDTEKAKRVIPNKVYQYLACAKPIITGDSLAIRELLEHDKHVYLCELADSKSLSDTIIKLKKDICLRNKLAANGYKQFVENCRPSVIGSQVSNIIEKIYENRMC